MTLETVLAAVRRVSMALAPLRPAPDLISLVALGLGLGGAALLAAGWVSAYTFTCRFAYGFTCRSA